MSRVYMVRHGRAAAGWNVDPDPALDDLGREQAIRVASRLSHLGPLPVLSSPLLRCQQTAFPLATAWKVESVVEPLVGEIPSPEGFSVEDRGGWLREAMAGTWTEVAARSGERYADYRRSIARRIGAIDVDTVVFSHFVAINAVIGSALDDDRVVVAHLDNCSVTILESHPDGRLELVETGNQADTPIG